MSARAVVAACALLLAAAPAAAQLFEPPLIAVQVQAPPADPRFFGLYCQTQSFDVCEDVFFGLFDACVTVAGGRMRVRHTATARGGVVSGSGTFTADGEATGLSMVGEVRAPGVVRGFAAAPMAGKGFGWAFLSDDGLALRVEALGQSVTLRKDACGNAAPTITLTSLAGGTLDFGRQAGFRAQITDEDPSFPPERVTFSSSRDGPLEGSLLFPAGLPGITATFFTDRLTAGPHAITVTVVDSGGRTGRARVDVTVVNQAPNQVEILRPAATAEVVRGGVFFLEGKAFDPEEFLLPGPRLRWSTKLGTQPFVDQGTGARREMSFPLPSDPAANIDASAVIRLTATDSSGNESLAERTIAVRRNAGNTPPRVAILFPSDLNVGVFDLLTAGPRQFVATALDAEDPPEALALSWQCQVVSGAAGSCPVFDPGTSTSTTAVILPTEATLYAISFTATDSGGLSDTKTVQVFVLQSGAIP
jgi:hypothetical protein